MGQSQGGRGQGQQAVVSGSVEDRDAAAAAAADADAAANADVDADMSVGVDMGMGVAVGVDVRGQPEGIEAVLLRGLERFERRMVSMERRLDRMGATLESRLGGVAEAAEWNRCQLARVLGHLDDWDMYF